MTDNQYKDKMQGEEVEECNRKRQSRASESDDPGNPITGLPDALPLGPINFPKGPLILEVVFNRAIDPEDLRTALASPSDALHSNVADLTGLLSILRRFPPKLIERSFKSLQNIERSFSESDQEDAAIKYGRENFLRFHFGPDADAALIYQGFNRLPMVEAAVPVPKAIPPAEPLGEPYVGNNDQIEDDLVETQWYAFRCHVNCVWDKYSGASVVIADIDHGFCIDHEELNSRIKLTHNSVDGSNRVDRGDEFNHGTAVLGLAGAAVNGLGIAGFAFGADLWAIQANCGNGTVIEGDPWANAIDFVRETSSGLKRKVILLEHETEYKGNYEMVLAVRRAIRDAIDSNIVVCVAAGNGPRDAGVSDVGECIPPTGSILVGATEYNRILNVLAKFSNYGRRIIVSAPGDQHHDRTCKCDKKDPYRNGFGGTSGATAKVAGAVALMLEANPKLSHQDVREILSDGPPIVTYSNRLGGRFLDVKAAVEKAEKRKGRTPPI